MEERVPILWSAETDRARALVALLVAEGIDARPEGAAGEELPREDDAGAGTWITVPRPDVERAVAVLGDAGDAPAETGWPAREEEDDRAEPPRLTTLPASGDPVWPPLAALTLLHLLLLSATGERDRERLFAWGALPGTLPAEEGYRLVTSAFLHADLAHLAGNTAYLLLFGFTAIRLFGLPPAALAYALGAVAGGVAAVIALPPDAQSVGASGAVYALAGATIAGRLRLARAAPLPRRERWRLAGFGAVLAAGILAANWPAHLGGVAAGALLGASMRFAGGWSAGGRWLAAAVAAALLAGPWIWKAAAG